MIHKNYRTFINVSLSVFIIIITLIISKRFLTSLIWASIISIATYPIYNHFSFLFKKNATVAILEILGLPFSLAKVCPRSRICRW